MLRKEFVYDSTVKVPIESFYKNPSSDSPNLDKVDTVDIVSMAVPYKETMVELSLCEAIHGGIKNLVRRIYNRFK